MRLGIVAICLAGCGFRPGATTDAQPTPDANGDGNPLVIDAPDAAVAPAACLTAVGYVNNPTNGHGYRVAAGPFTRDGAVDACTTDGAHLVVMNDTSENTFVRTIANNVWIGLDDLTTEGTFRWVTGAPLGFTTWAPGEPNNANGTEDCAYMTPSTQPQWNDTNCGDMRGAVCECETGYTPPPVKACRSAAGGKVINGRLYFLHTTAKTWQAARDDCASNGAYLMVPSDVDEDNIVNDGNGLNTNSNVWIGLSDLQTMGTWQWIDNSPFGFAYWTTAAPFAGAGQDCVIMQGSDQKWANLTCSSNQKYVCECD